MVMKHLHLQPILNSKHIRQTFPYLDSATGFIYIQKIFFINNFITSLKKSDKVGIQKIPILFNVLCVEFTSDTTEQMRF
jgi:hypothetical protein